MYYISCLCKLVLTWSFCCVIYESSLKFQICVVSGCPVKPAFAAYSVDGSFSMKKSLCIVLSVLLGVGLCMGAFSLSAFAYNVSAPVEVSTTTTPTSGTLAYVDSNSRYNLYFYYASTQIFVCALSNGSYQFFCTASGASLARSYDNSQSVIDVNQTVIIDGITYYCKNFAFSYGSGNTLPVYSSVSDFYSDCLEYLNPSPEPVIDHTVSMYIQPGTMVRVKSPGNLTWNLETTFDYTCRKQNAAYVWLYNSCYYFTSSFSAPLGFSTSSFVQYIESYNQNLIPWLRLAPTNIFGNSYNAKYASVSALNGDYLYIYIPVIDYNFVDSWFFSGLFHKDSQNHPVLLECDNASEIVVYTMGDSVSNGFIVGTTQSQYSYTEYGNFENAQGDVVSQVDSSSADADPETHTLDSLVSQISSYFSGVWGHISSLISVLDTFPSFVVQLYGWLPAEFRAVLLSAFSIAMVVGVLKVML